MGLASEAERAQVAEDAAKNPAVKAELAAIEAAMETYARLNAVKPSPSLNTKILQGINKINSSIEVGNNHAPDAKVVPISAFWKYAAAASVILLIGSAVLNLFYYNKITTTNTAYEKTQTELLAANEALSELNENISVVKNKYSKAVSLDGLPAAPDAAAKIFWMKNTGELYIDPSNLPEAPAGMQYQLWGIVDGKPVDAGMIIISKEDKKFHVQKMKSFGKAEAFAVTLETTGGNPTPLGKMYVMGEM